MADFAPETTITIYKGTGVDNQNQPYFTSESAKMSWYGGHSPKTYELLSYQRTERRYCRIAEHQTAIADYDILAFKNSAGRWIICNIIWIEFINPNCTEITFEINWFQTYIDVIEWCDCFILREMQENDWIGGRPSFNNTVPEGIETGQLKATTQTDLKTFTDFKIVVLSAYDIHGEPDYDVQEFGGGYASGLNVFTFPNVEGLSSLLDTYAQKGRLDGVAAVMMCPIEYANVNTTWKGPQEELQIDFGPYGGYDIQNAKLFTGEFFQITLSNRAGNAVNLKLENFMNPELGTFRVTYEGAFQCGAGGCICYPNNYMGMLAAKDYGVILFNDLHCAWVGNGYENWVAQNKNTLAISTVGDIANGILRAGRGAAEIGVASVTGDVPGVIGGAANVVGGLAGSFTTLGKIADSSAHPACTGGHVNASALSLALETYGFMIQYLRPTIDMTRRIDKFLSRYGYRTLETKKPNVNTRPYWNYVETQNAVVKGPIPYPAKLAIQADMDSGVTFWNVTGGAIIGDFEKDNRG